MKKIYVYFTLLSIILLNILSVEESEASSGSYTVTPIFGENQKEGIESYFYLNAVKDVEEFEDKVRFSIKNNINEEITIQVKSLDALTADNGSIHYEEHNKSKLIISDPTYLFTTYNEIDTTIKLKANEKKEFSFDIKSPTLGGHLLGAISFSNVSEGEPIEGEGSQFIINSEVKTVYAIMIDFNRDRVVDFYVGEPTMELNPSYYNINLPIINNSNVILEKAKLLYKVEDSKGEVLFSNNTDGEVLTLSPKTTSNFDIGWAYDTIKENETYTIKGIIEPYGSKGEEDTHIFEKTFKLDSSKILKNGENSPNIQIIKDETKLSNNMAILITSGVSLIVILLCVLFIKTYKAKKEAQSQLEEVIRNMELEEVISKTHGDPLHIEYATNKISDSTDSIPIVDGLTFLDMELNLDNYEEEIFIIMSDHNKVPLTFDNNNSILEKYLVSLGCEEEYNYQYNWYYKLEYDGDTRKYTLIGGEEI